MVYFSPITPAIKPVAGVFLCPYVFDLYLAESSLIVYSVLELKKVRVCVVTSQILLSYKKHMIINKLLYGVQNG